MELRHKFDVRRQKKVIKFIQKLNDFEKQWMENVRFEIYWADKFQQIIDVLRDNVKASKVVRFINGNRVYAFLLQLKKMSDQTHQKQLRLTLKFNRRSQRSVLKELSSNIVF